MTPFLRQLPKFGQGTGLERVRALLNDLSDSSWYQNLDALKITGSNGKGSVAAFSAALLQASGLSCGLYTSPHLRRFSERIRVNGAEISDADLAASTAWVEERIRAEGLTGETGAFEAFTALALHHFARSRPAAVVLEAGIGGRYDPTRVPPGRFVALTSVDLEHTELLGETEGEILDQKVDLTPDDPDGGTLVHGPLSEALLHRLQQHAADRGLRLLSSRDEVQIHLHRQSPEGSVVDLQMGELTLPEVTIALPGRHQLANAAIAVVLVREWLKLHHPPRLLRYPQAVRQALAAVTWPGQFERVHRNPDVYVDHAHTPDAIRRLTTTVQELFPARPLLLVTGVSGDKAVDEILEALLEGLPGLDTVLCTRAHHKGAPVAEIRRRVTALRPDARILAEDRIEDAMEQALDIAHREDRTVLVAGGLFLAVEAGEVLRGGDPGALEFF